MKEENIISIVVIVVMIGVTIFVVYFVGINPQLKQIKYIDRCADLCIGKGMAYYDFVPKQGLTSRRCICIDFESRLEEFGIRSD